ncbi:MAG: DUF3786 domain-containing protein [Armatimonadetes bacterium]|nr:DUF3786 domain-containing protein [Armatimonadota bacterium]
MLPPGQKPYDLALQIGLDALVESPPSKATLEALGARRKDNVIFVPALNMVLLVDLLRRDVFVKGSGKAKRKWAVLCVHYLGSKDVSVDSREMTFNRFLDAQSYGVVYQKRIIGRFLATSGRTAEQFIKLSEKIGGERLPEPGVRYRFFILPRVPVILVRYEGDEEIGPGANVIYQADIEHLLPAEDRVVSAELLLDALSGVDMTELS